MYGIVNQAVEGVIIQNFGVEKWEEVKKESGVSIETFLSNEPYDDSVTYALATAATKVLALPLSDILKALGEYWILETGLKNYGPLLKSSGGGTLKEFLINLPNFHSRVMLMYPNLRPPEFQITAIEETSLKLHYYSEREGLADFVVGLIHGLAKMFETTVQVEMIAARAEGDDHEIFLIQGIVS